MAQNFFEAPNFLGAQKFVEICGGQKRFYGPTFLLGQIFSDPNFLGSIFFQIQFFLPSLAPTPTQVGTESALILTHPQNK